MAGKITIRRAGGLLPALCLVVFILLASLITWLSTAGLPGFVLKRMEAEAAAKGVFLKVGKLKLSPASGLALRARRVALYATAGDTAPLATLERATVAISLSSLLRGRLVPTMAEFRDLDISVPTDGEAPLRIENATASAIIKQGNMVRLTSAIALLEGVPVKLRGAFLLPEKKTQQTDETSASASGGQEEPPLDIAALLAPWKDEAGRLRSAIASQGWAGESRPSVDLQLLAIGKLQLSARVSLPRYDEGQFHFRNANLDIAYQDNSIIINQAHFHTVEPESEITLQGGYDLPARQLSVNLRSTAALTRMAEALALHGVKMYGIDEWLNRFHHPDDAPPTISLRGDICFEEDFTLKSINMQGELSQRNFTFGQTEVDALTLSFHYRDGSFNIDTLQLNFPTGSLTASASASSTTNRGRAHIIADLDIPHLLQLAGEFTPEPLRLPEGLELSGNLKLDVRAELDTPDFVSGSRQLGQFLPALRQLELSAGIGSAAHFGHRLEQPRLSLKLSGVQQAKDSLVPHGLAEAELSVSAESATLPGKEEGADATTVRLAQANLRLRGLSMAEGAANPHIASAEGSLQLGSLALPGFSAEAVEMELRGVENIRPMAENWRRVVQQGSLRLTTGAMHSGNTLLGAADTRLSLDAEGHIDLATVLVRDNHRINLDLHPQLTEDGLLVLEQVEMELPAAGFAPLLSLTGTHITQILLPDNLTLSGSAIYDTRGKYLRQAEGTLNIPHLVRTPGAGIPGNKGMEIPLSLTLNAAATGREDGHVALGGKLTVIHKRSKPGAEDDRELNLSFNGDSAGHLHFEGTNTIDVNTVDALIDLYSAHTIMRDFRTHSGSRTDVDIRAVDIDWRDGLTVTASCDARIVDIGYQLGAYISERDTHGRPTGKEELRKDFGKDPFRKVEKARAHVDVLYRHNAAGEVQDTRISILNADITYDNRPWLRSQGFKGGEPRSRLQGDAIIIDVERSFVELKNIHGRAYPAYAIGAYYDQLPVFMQDIILQQPANLQTAHCLFPIYHDCKEPMSGCIRVMADRAGFRFLGTTFPLTSFSGFICFKDGTVRLDRLNAACWDGAVNATFDINYTAKRTGFDGYATLRNINLQPLAAAYGSKQQPALCNGNIRFRTPTSRVRDLQAYGDICILDGDLMNLSIFRPVGDLISDLPGNLAQLEQKALSSQGGSPTWIDRQLTRVFETTGDAFSNVGSKVGKVTNNIPFANHFLRYDLQEVEGKFSIANGKLITQDMTALGYNLNVGLELAIDIEKSTLNGDIWPKISSIPTIVLSPITFLSDFMIDIHVYGPLDDIKWRFGLNRKKPGEKNECSATDRKPRQNKKTRRP